MANFESFHLVISSSTNLLFLKSELFRMSFSTSYRKKHRKYVTCPRYIDTYFLQCPYGGTKV